MNSRILVIFTLLLSSPILTANQETPVDSPAKNTEFYQHHETKMDYVATIQRENMSALVAQPVNKAQV